MSSRRSIDPSLVSLPGETLEQTRERNLNFIATKVMSLLTIAESLDRSLFLKAMEEAVEETILSDELGIGAAWCLAYLLKDMACRVEFAALNTKFGDPQQVM